MLELEGLKFGQHGGTIGVEQVQTRGGLMVMASWFVIIEQYLIEVLMCMVLGYTLMTKIFHHKVREIAQQM